MHYPDGYDSNEKISKKRGWPRGPAPSYLSKKKQTAADLVREVLAAQIPVGDECYQIPSCFQYILATIFRHDRRR